MKFIHMKRTFAKLVVSSLAISSMPLHCFSVMSIPSKIAVGIIAGTKASANCVKNGVFNSTSAVANVAKKGVTKTFGLVKTGAIKTKNLVASGASATYNLAKTGVSKLVPSKKNIKILASIAAVVGLIRFLSKKPSNDPSRFDYKKLSSKDPKEILNQVWYFIDDVVIGRSGKASVIKYSKDDDKLYVTKECEKQGFGGYVSESIKTMSDAIKFLTSIVILKSTMKHGFAAWKNWTSADEIPAKIEVVTIK